MSGNTAVQPGDMPGLHNSDNTGLHAIRMALATPFRDDQDCFRWLYGFGRTPLSLLAGGQPTESAMTIAQRTVLARTFSGQSDASWERWASGGQRPPPKFKLYINPLAHAFRSTVSRLAVALTHSDGLKIVSRSWMIGRPDKLIAYFRGEDRRASWISTYRGELSDIAGSPVPFTQTIDDIPAVSVATDPENGNESWRSGLLKAIARDILDLQGRADGYRQVLLRLERRGIDSHAWCRNGGTDA